ncbi:S1 family peptidase [Amycolatopsis sp. CA-230715]|uniref:S1 family peptidase n=1 Tax=Amycolatopsis sp. CA-230715 TaxID=2745196 RepID=UPI001C02DA8F|nr:S1 family peptidase [Amycolatopsis sp. CA-230715]QWF76680.1 Streptogrisin-D [Amycolatopsis sp. CA-230715]
MPSRKSLALFAAFSAAAMTTGVCAQTASADPLAFAQLQQNSIDQATQVTNTLGASSGGFYLDQGKAVVNVLDDTAAQTVRDAGLTAKKVAHSFAALTAAKDSLDQVHDVPQTAWGIDTRANQVVVTIYSAATPATAAKVTAAANRLGDRARIEHETGKLELYIADGDAIRNSSGRCSLGFNVKKGSTPYLLTAGHCTNLGGTWSGGDVTGARIVHSDCPGADSGLLTRPNGTGPGRINTGQVISRAGTPTVGERIQKQGSTTGGGSGTVKSVDQSVNFDVGVLNHEFGTSAHTDHGDSGGPAYDGSTGLGTLSGGNSTTSYFYPLTRELSSYGVTLA